MTRQRLGLLAAVLAIIGLLSWIARSTTWVELKVPMPPRGEAATNPFYGAQRFAERLGARTVRDRTFATPPPHAVVVLSQWDWNLSGPRRQRIESWVEAGGRLLVDVSVARDAGFGQWAGVRLRPLASSTETAAAANAGACEAVSEDDGSGRRLRTSYQLCGVIRAGLESDGPRLWGLLDERDALRGLRVAKGRGTVTVLSTSVVRGRELLDGDHGFIFTSAAGFVSGDEIHFLTESDHPSLLALTWREGAAIVGLLLAALALALWRGAVRFGPPAAAPPRARRSLAEQILGTGQFALRHGDGAALHAAVARALDEAARRRVAGYARLDADERTAAVARASQADQQLLAAAWHDTQQRRPDRLRNTIAQLEAARRRLLSVKGRSHGIE